MAEDSKGQREAKRWLSDVRVAKEKTSEWRRRGDRIIERYRDERTSSDPVTIDKMRRMNLLWSNVETLKPALYAQTPKPIAQRRNQDKDPVGRWASEVLQRCLTYQLDVYDFDRVMRQCVKDYLLSGRGQVWATYDPTIKSDDKGEYVASEIARCEYVHWKHFLTNEARTWDDVVWVSREFYLTRDQVKKRFGEEIGAAIQLDHRPDGTKDTDASETSHKATIQEIWNRNERVRVFVSPGYSEGVLEIGDPPIKFQDFFPCPRPLTATTAPDTIVPTPDFVLYQDQADEIDRLTQKINVLIRALRYKGFYDASIGDLQNLMGDSDDADMLAIANWASFAQQGGLKGAVDFMPLKELYEALQACIEARESTKAALYEVTGIADVIRGASNPNETATAQSIKSQWGGLRVRDRQHDVQRFARDIIRLKAEIISEHFGDDTIKEMSGVKLLTMAEKQRVQMAVQQIQQAQQQAQAVAQQNPQAAQQMAQQASAMQPPPQVMELMQEPAWEEVLGLLRNDKIRGFQIDIETDSTVEPDRAQERQDRTEFVAAMSQLLGNAASVPPELAPLAGELLTFAVRAWPVADTLETEIENAMDALEKKAANPQPSPEAMEMQAKAKQAEVEAGQKDREIGIKEREVAIKEADSQAKRDLEMAQEQNAAAQATLATPAGVGLAQAMQQMAQTMAAQMQQSAAQQQQMIQWMQSFTDTMMRNQQAMIVALSAPKEVMRGPDGRVVGVQTIMPVQQAAE